MCSFEIDLKWFTCLENKTKYFKFRLDNFEPNEHRNKRMDISISYAPSRR